MDKLKDLLSRCKCSVQITVNGHRDVYETAEQALNNYEGMECPPQIEPDVRKKMIDLNTIVNVHFYPETPIGFYDIYHYDLDAALEQALACFGEEV